MTTLASKGKPDNSPFCPKLSCVFPVLKLVARHDGSHLESHHSEGWGRKIVKEFKVILGFIANLKYRVKPYFRKKKKKKNKGRKLWCWCLVNWATSNSGSFGSLNDSWPLISTVIMRISHSTHMAAVVSKASLSFCCSIKMSFLKTQQQFLCSVSGPLTITKEKSICLQYFLPNKTAQWWCG